MRRDKGRFDKRVIGYEMNLTLAFTGWKIEQHLKHQLRD